MVPFSAMGPRGFRAAAFVFALLGFSTLVACSGVRNGDGGDSNSTDGNTAGDGSDAFGDDATADTVTDAPVATPLARFVLPRSGPNAFLLPWPSDLALTSSGFVDFGWIPNPINNPMVMRYQMLMANRVAGYSTIGAVYFRFNSPIDTSTLPASLAASAMPPANVQLIDIDPMSSQHGQRHPLQSYFRERAGRYWSANTLAIAPAFGHPLRGHTRYAAVITRRVRTADGRDFQRDADLDAILSPSGGDAMVGTARAAYEPAIAEIERTGIARDQILNVAVFTTQDPVGELFRMVDFVQANVAPPTTTDLTAGTAGAEYQIFRGHFGPNPVFQSGAPPYTVGGSGDIQFDSTGRPIVQRTEPIRYAVTVPSGEPPTGGWPIAIYAHGTGGTASSFISDGTALSLAAQGIATLGFDQIFNGERAVMALTPMAAEAQFFNFDNPVAGRNNNRQAAIDLVTAGRFARALRIPAATSGRTEEITFNGDRVMFFGHSQGGLNGPLWMAAEDVAGAGIWSGAGGTILISIIQKTEPINIPIVLGTGLGLGSSGLQELVSTHPTLTMIQTIIDCEDPVNYARFVAIEPRMGQRARHVFQTLGLIDHYTPPDAIASLATAAGFQLANPVLRVWDFYDLLGMPARALPISANLAGNTVTGVWQQFNAGTRDGHFVVFEIAAARMRTAQFLAAYAHALTPVLVP